MFFVLCGIRSDVSPVAQLPGLETAGSLHQLFVFYRRGDAVVRYLDAHAPWLEHEHAGSVRCREKLSADGDQRRDLACVGDTVSVARYGEQSLHREHGRPRLVPRILPLVDDLLLDPHFLTVLQVRERVVSLGVEVESMGGVCQDFVNLDQQVLFIEPRKLIFECLAQRFSEFPYYAVRVGSEIAARLDALVVNGVSHRCQRSRLGGGVQGNPFRAVTPPVGKGEAPHVYHLPFRRKARELGRQGVHGAQAAISGKRQDGAGETAFDAPILYV